MRCDLLLLLLMMATFGQRGLWARLLQGYSHQSRTYVIFSIAYLYFVHIPPCCLGAGTSCDLLPLTLPLQEQSIRQKIAQGEEE
jgi:hypothetical protein